MITPTIGRIVWYHPHTEDPDLRGFVSHVSDGRPLAGIVVNVWSDTCVNLAVFDPNGRNYSRTSVFLYQGDGDRPSSSFAEWMPYQKGQAAKTEALEKQLPASDPSLNLAKVS